MNYLPTFLKSVLHVFYSGTPRNRRPGSRHWRMIRSLLSEKGIPP
jgi:hypothetical protein